MGLDIYYYRVKNKEIAETFIKYAKDYDTAYDKYYHKYESEIKVASKKWNEWYNSECDRIETYTKEHPDDEPPNFDYSNEPKYDITDFMDNLEKADWQLITTKYNSVKSDINYDDDYEDLYMRKENWMVNFVQKIHPECLVEDKEFGKIIKQGMVVLTKDDVKELIKRMDTILYKKIKTYTESTGKPESNDGIFCTDEFINWKNRWTPKRHMLTLAKELLPTMGRFFFGSLDYNYNYFSSLEYYRDKFKKWLKIRNNKEVLLYNESW